MSPTNEKSFPIPVAISARHAHLTQATLERLFGDGFRLLPAKQLSQPHEFAAAETVTVVGPHGRLEHVRLLGPPRHEDQVELSRSDALQLGLDAHVRVSGDLHDTLPASLSKGRQAVSRLRTALYWRIATFT
jgi:propanediol utilization protein